MPAREEYILYIAITELVVHYIGPFKKTATTYSLGERKLNCTESRQLLRGEDTHTARVAYYALQKKVYWDSAEFIRCTITMFIATTREGSKESFASFYLDDRVKSLALVIHLCENNQVKYYIQTKYYFWN